MNDLPDEAQLLEAIRKGDEDAFRAVFRRHTPRLYAIVRRLLGRQHAQADDVVQEVWLRAVKGLSSFRGDSLFATWLVGIAIRSAREALRRRTWEEDDESSPAGAIPSLELALDLEAAVAALPAGYRAVLVLHDVHGYTHREIAGLLDFTEGTSKSQLSRARRDVRRRLGSPPKEP